MSKERSPRELCSTTMGTRGIKYSFSIQPLSPTARPGTGGPVYPRGGRPLGRAAGGPERALADLQPHALGAAQLERLAQRRQVPQQAVAAGVGVAEVERVERLGARLGRHPGRDEQVARDDGPLAGVD